MLKKIKVNNNNVTVPEYLLDVFSAILPEGSVIEDIIIKSKSSISDVSYKLTILEMYDLIGKDINGKFYRKN